MDGRLIRELFKLGTDNTQVLAIINKFLILIQTKKSSFGWFQCQKKLNLGMCVEEKKEIKRWIIL